MAPVRQVAGMAFVVLLGLVVGVLLTLQFARVNQTAEPAFSEDAAGPHAERVRMLERKHSLLRGQLDLVAAELEQARSQCLPHRRHKSLAWFHV